MYTPEALNHFVNPLNAGTLKEKSISHLIGSPHTGAVLQLHLAIHENRITDAKFKAYGAVSIMCMSWLTQRIKGMSLEEALHVEAMEIATQLSLPTDKIYHCLLAVDVLQEAILKYIAVSDKKHISSGTA